MKFDFSKIIIKKLEEKNLTVTFAESCTGGLLASMLCDISGASSVFKGSFVTYSNETKVNFLGVDKKIIDEFFAVSRQTAEAMAKCARQKANADIAISVTGLAGPLGDESGKEVGTCYIGISTKNGEKVKKIETHSKSRFENRRYFAVEAFEFLSGEIEKIEENAK